MEKATKENWEKEFDKGFAIGIGRNWFFTEDEAKEIKSFIRQLLKEEKAKDRQKAFSEGEKSMANGVLRRIKSGKNLKYIEILCKAVAGN